MILVTGASGYVGANLLKYLSQRNNFEVKCLLRTGSKTLPFKNINIAYGDILDKDSLLKALQDIESIIHIAAVINPRKVDEFYQVNYIGTRNIVECAKKKGIKKIVFLSSFDATTDVETFYGNSKKNAEDIIIKSGIEYVILRPTVIYGGEKDYTFSKLVSFIKKFPFVPVIGNGHQLLQPIYIDDLIKIILLSLEDRYKNRTYNIAGTEKLSQREIIKTIARFLNKKIILIPIPEQPATLVLKAILFLDKAKIISDKIKLLSLDKVTNIKEMEKDFDIPLTKFKDGIKSIC